MTLLLAGAAIVVVTATIMVAAGVLANRPPLADPPGTWQRLRVYLTRNVAETRPDPEFPELAPLRLRGEAPALLEAVAAACRALGWHAVSMDRAARRVRAEVRSPLFGFRDDVVVTLLPEVGPVTEGRVRSASRVGRGDLGANARHVMDLRARLVADGIVDDGESP